MAIDCSCASSAAAGFTPTTTIGTRLVVPLAVTLRNELAVVATLWLARYALSPLSFPDVMSTTTVLRHVRLTDVSAVIAAIAAAFASSSA